jgi:uncharacterized metal-binding protein YceD (DUF177 family)
MDKTENPWSVELAVEDVPENGLHRDIEALEPVRAALAKLAGVRALPQLAAAFDLARRGSGIHVSGRVKARVEQTCVVTLDPMESVVEEMVDLLFLPGAVAAGHDEGDPPEPLIGGKIDLGAIAAEFFLLGIDPYPRKRGAEFVPPSTESGGEHPFASLAPLKKRLGGGQS